MPATFGPAIMPSVAMSVYTSAAIGSPANRPASSVAATSLVAAQPSVATRPPGRRSPAPADRDTSGTSAETSRAPAMPGCRSPIAPAPGRATRESIPQCGCRRRVRTARRPLRQSTERCPDWPACPRGPRPGRPDGGSWPPRRPNAWPWRPDRCRKWSPACNRPAEGVRISPLEGRSPARFPRVNCSCPSPGAAAKHTI